jgi:DNA repair exonuclease SbcCD ATPase subunit
MEDYLIEYGKLINQKNDVDKKRKNKGEINLLTVENENTTLKNQELSRKLKEYEDSLLKINENKTINEKIENLKNELSDIEEEKTNYQNSIYEKKLEIGNLESRINEMREVINQFKRQERRDEIFSYYKKCVHRDGIPKQMLVNHIVPRINSFISELLAETPFSIWLDETTLRPKIRYNERPDSVIDCISASGKERTYSSIVLKFALNQINVKSKPKMFMIDEIMGKLDDNSVEEFVQIMHTIKRYMNRVLVVEHSHNVLPDYLIDVTLNENGLSEALLIDN